MKGSIRNQMAAGILLSMAVPVLAEVPSRESVNTNSGIIVRVYNYTKTADSHVERAQREADRILRRAGIRATWIRCGVSPLEGDTNPRCKQTLGPGTIGLKVLPDKMASGFGKAGDTFGFAIYTPMPAAGWAYIFSEQAEELARYGSFPVHFEVARTLILGHVMAHEIGHLLLGEGSHSSSGIMCFPWRPRVLARMAKGQLHFSEKQAKKMRAGIPTDEETLIAGTGR